MVFLSGCSSDVSFKVETASQETVPSFNEIYDPYRQVSQSVRIDLEIDILFVIDNSGSMIPEHRQLAERLDKFTDYLTDLNWRIAVTSTNAYEGDEVPESDGKLYPFPNREFYIDHTLEESLAMRYLKETVPLTPHPLDSTVGCEQGIRATYRAIQRIDDIVNVDDPYKNMKVQNKQFFRDESALAVILISDEDECAGPISFETQPDQLIQLVRNKWGEQKTFVFHSIIVKEGDSSCASRKQHVEGLKYAELSRKTDGVIGSVCALDYAGQLRDIGSHVREQALSMKLDCIPVDRDNNGNENNDITVQLEGGSIVTDFTYNGDEQELYFSESLLEGTYNLEYTCEKDPHQSQ